MQNKTDNILHWISKTINRKDSQVVFLLEILHYDFGMYFELEESIKRFHASYCPGDFSECAYLIGKLRVWKAMGWIDETSKCKYLKWERYGLIRIENV